jgi:hypothetical protein
MQVRVERLNLESTGAAPAMVDVTPFLPGLSPVQGKAVVARLGAGIGPFAQAGLDEAFGFAIGARGVRPGSQMAQVMTGAGLPQHLAAIAVAVVVMTRSTATPLRAN